MDIDNDIAGLDVLFAWSMLYLYMHIYTREEIIETGSQAKGIRLAQIDNTIYWTEDNDMPGRYYSTEATERLNINERFIFSNLKYMQQQQK